MANMSLMMRIGAVVDGTLDRAIGGVNRDLTRLDNTTAQLTARQQRLGNIMARSLTRPNADLGRLHRNYQRITRQIEETRRAQERLNRSIERGRRVGELQSNAGGNFATSTAQLTAFAVPVGAAIKQAAEFQDNLTDLAITGGWTADEQARIGEMTRQSALKYNQTLGDIGEGMGTLVAGGISSAKALDEFTPKMARIATAWRTSFEDIANTTLALQNNLGIGSDGYDRAMNMLGYAGKAGQFEASDMAKWLPSLTPFYQTLGIQGEEAVAEIGAALQIARKGAGSSDEAANNMRNFMAKLTAPDTLKDFDKAGIDLEQSMKNLVGKGMTPMQAMLATVTDYVGSKSPEAAAEFTKAMAIKDDKERQMAVDRLAETYKLGELFQDQQALSFIRPMLGNQEEFEQIKSGSINAADNDGIGADFDQRMGSPMEKFKRFKIYATDLAVTIGDALLPAINDTLIALNPLLKRFNNWAKQNPELITSTVKIVGGLLLAKAAFWGLSFGVLSVVSPIMKMVTLFNRLRAGIAVLRGMAVLGRFAPMAMRFGRAIGFIGKAFRVLRIAGMALMTNPIFLAIGLLAGAAYLIYRNWDKIGPYFSRLWNRLKTFAKSGVGNVIRTIASFTPLGMFIRALSPLMPYFIRVWQRLKAFAKSGIVSILRTIASFKPVGLFIRAFSAVFGYLSNLSARFRQYGINIIQGLISGITAKFGALKAKMSSLASSVAGVFSGKLEINSPSKLFTRIAHSIPEGIGLGVTNKAGVALGAIRTLSSRIGQSKITSPQVSDTMAKRLAQTEYSNKVLGGQSLSDGMRAGAIQFSPTINVQVGIGDSDVATQVQRGLSASYEEFERMLAQVEANRQRRAFA